MDATELKLKLSDQREQIAALIELWKSLIPLHVPSEQNFRYWLLKHNFEIVTVGIRQTGLKFMKVGPTMPLEWMVKFASAVMLDKTRKAKEKT